MSAVVADVIAVRVPERSWRSEARAARTVWRREMIRFMGDRAGVLMVLVQPLLFLFVLGAGLGTLSAASMHGVDLKTFIFPGVLCMGVLFPAIFNAATLVWDRELGFLKELLVAPVSRTSILVGKCLGGATVASAQGAIVLAFAGLVGVPYDPVMILGVIGLLLVLSFTLNAFGVLVAVRIKQPQTFTRVSQMLVVPLFFLSAAFFPVSRLPGWLGVLNRIDPLTYAVDPMRRLVFHHLDVSAAARARLDPGVSWWGWHLSPWFETGMVLALGLGVMGLAIRQFARAR